MLTSLLSKFDQYFSKCPDHEVKTLMALTLGIFRSQTPNLWKVKDQLGPILENQQTTRPESNYRRLTRFFCLDDEVKQAFINGLLFLGLSILRNPGGKRSIRYLTMDGTSWEFGQKKVHLLTLSIVYQGVSLPIWWLELDKKGISSVEERKQLIQEALQRYDLSGLILLADREYIGPEWFEFLTQVGLEFIIRLKSNIYHEQINHSRTESDSPFQSLRFSALKRKAAKARYRNTGVAKTITLEGNTYLFVVFKNPKPDAEEPFLFFLSTLNKAKKVVKAYPIRWSIECCFKHLKTNGFRLEEINLEDSNKIRLMMAILVFLYILALDRGWADFNPKAKASFKRYADGKQAMAISIFRRGIPQLVNLFTSFLKFLDFIAKAIALYQIPRWCHVQ